MQEELQRIKKKDYSKIDQKLFENMLRTDNLTSTLSQLSQFQQFLMQQINTLNQEPNTAAVSLQKSITKNFDTLRESLVQCSRIVCQNQKVPGTTALKKKITALKDEISKTKQEVRQEMKVNFQSAKDNAETTCRYLLSSLEKERLIRKQCQQKCTKLVKENESLKKENQELKKHKTEDIKTSRIIAETEPPNEILDLSTQTAKYMPKSHQTQEVSYPLKEKQSYNEMYSVPSFSEKQWKIAPIERENRFSTAVKQNSVSKRSSLSRQSSSHQLTNKQNLILLKENKALLYKGVKEERRKSKQKIKIFSMI